MSQNLRRSLGNGSSLDEEPVHPQHGARGAIEGARPRKPPLALADASNSPAASPGASRRSARQRPGPSPEHPAKTIREASSEPPAPRGSESSSTKDSGPKKVTAELPTFTLPAQKSVAALRSTSSASRAAETRSGLDASDGDDSS